MQDTLGPPELPHILRFDFNFWIFYSWIFSKIYIISCNKRELKDAQIWDDEEYCKKYN